MDYERLIALNRYTRDDIFSLCGKRPEKQSVICIGNIMARKQLERNIKASIPTTVIGHGRYTAVLEICDRLGLKHKDSFNGDLFNRLPFMRPNMVYIVWNPDKRSKLLKEYIKENVCIIIISDDVTYTKEVISLRQITQIKEYEAAKGYPIILHDGLKPIEREEQLIARHLKGENVYPLPEHAHRWLSRAFPNNENVQTICALAEQTKNPLYYHGVLGLIRHKKAIKLRYPTWVKRK